MATEHRLDRRPRAFRGKVRGGAVIGCTCGVLTIARTTRDGLLWHAEHRRMAVPVVLPVDKLQATLDALTKQFAEVTGCG